MTPASDAADPPAAAGRTGPTGPAVIRVLIVDDDPLVRAGLSMILGGAAELRVVGEAGDGAEVPAAVAACRPDVVLMDIRMPQVDGLAATEALRARPDAPQVVVLTTFDADEYVLRALRAGASGFLLKDTPPAEIVAAVRRVHAGEPMLSPAVIRRLITHVAGLPADPATAVGPSGVPATAVGPHAVPATAVGRRPGPQREQAGRRDRARRLLDQLSPRERDVAVAVGQGRSNAEIAAELFMSVATVKAYVSRLLARLELNNRVQVALLVHDADLC
ncbi:response regulator transcription factor [Solwaraspora sp. WMMA2056]|uniref:response regulator transcription factor n=1 Tax=Solwaraspora sp. WMMA2056 TaxID=3015161 RepID=UPI00259B0AC0|nr:response regulator transcription factor [Solwaraspora sp. WMMA2056]WJK42702.1 response regulator transcription factor [Solwaraspora sp. WMMA2056]